MKKQGLKFDHVENYYPMIVNTSKEAGKGWIHKEVSDHYNSRAGSLQKEGQVFGGVSPSGGGTVSVTTPQWYLPEFASPDRLFFPSTPEQAMKYWRFFYALDPVCGNVIDMYAEMILSDVELTGEGLSGEIKDMCYDALQDTEALNQFRWLVVGYLVDGEVVPHLIWDDDESRWTYLGFQDPINLEILDVPFIGTDPYLELKLPASTKEILMNPDPGYQKFRDAVPDELLSAVQSGRPLTLDTEKNVKYIARKLNPYDVRGIGIFSRLWRVFMYEDAIFNASIQTARRHASPIKVAKLGNPQTGWIPGVEHENRLRNLLAVAETDPHAWLIYHFGVSFEAWGTTDRTMSINREWDIIERIKLVALGTSKAFLHGETTYASAEKGLQVFLSRLQGMRKFFEETWWYPRFFGVMAERNNWIKPTQAELSHGVRTKRSKYELYRDRRYIVPKMMWEESLDPQSKSDQARMYMELKDRLGINISRTTASATVGVDWEEEEKRYREEEVAIKKMDEELQKQLEKENLVAPASPAGEEGAGGAGGGMGGGPPMGGMAPEVGVAPEGELAEGLEDATPEDLGIEEGPGEE